MPVLTRKDLTDFTNSFLFGMRQRYQASNGDQAQMLNNLIAGQPVQPGYEQLHFTGSFLRGIQLGKVVPSKEHLQAMYDLYLRCQLEPTQDTAWTGLLAVHRYLTNDDGFKLPPHLHTNGLASWMHRYPLPTKESL